MYVHRVFLISIPLIDVLERECVKLLKLDLRILACSSSTFLRGSAADLALRKIQTLKLQNFALEQFNYLACSGKSAVVRCRSKVVF